MNIKSAFSLVCKVHSRFKHGLTLGLTVEIRVGGSLAFPDTVSFHVPIVPLTSLAVHPLGLEIQVGGNANPEAYEESYQSVEDCGHLRPGFSRDCQDNNEETQNHGCVPGNPARPAAASKENRPHHPEPENTEPVHRVTEETPRSDQSPD